MVYCATGAATATRPRRVNHHKHLLGLEIFWVVSMAAVLFRQRLAVCHERRRLSRIHTTVVQQLRVTGPWHRRTANLHQANGREDASKHHGRTQHRSLPTTFSTIGNAWHWQSEAPVLHPFDESDSIMSEIGHIRGEFGDGWRDDQRVKVLKKVCAAPVRPNQRCRCPNLKCTFT